MTMINPVGVGRKATKGFAREIKATSASMAFKAAHNIVEQRQNNSQTPGTEDPTAFSSKLTPEDSSYDPIDGNTSLPSTAPNPVRKFLARIPSLSRSSQKSAFDSTHSSDSTLDDRYHNEPIKLGHDI